ncbi:translesion DNA synthesis-associated protein ImuA [Roseateles asaccharophilus]|uniref:Protein ImuA n=1 Tax=Roseateles asaccharophilus TaxID=582607 RepID=A0ABU2A3C8_9BURK|nr:translesion DNA synthesis-associated protein ImuA [Roseateles asaccharophilus]MDR7331017.1 protein ImuA [Roseateles asaccharophilus]
MQPAPFPVSDAPPRPVSPLDDVRLQGRLWRGSSLGATVDPTLPSGFTALDAELPGGGWPLRAVTELLTPQFGVLEWRLLAPALRDWWAGQALPAATPSRRTRMAASPLRPLLLINPPHTPHLPGLQTLGLPPSALIWVSPATPAQTPWAAEQAIKSRVAVLAWLPEARPEQIRRLQVCALGSDAPAFLVRPERAGQQSSAAPLRLVVQPGEGWTLNVRLLKRRGPAHEGWLALPAVPGAVEPLLTAAKRLPLPSPIPAPALEPAPLPTERHDALARPVLHA